MSLVLLCGPAFSGKTTLARALEARGRVRVSLDDLLRARGLEPGTGLPAERWGEALATACSSIERLGREGCAGVVDDTLCYRWLRDRFRETAARCGLGARLVVLRITRSEVLRRVEDNERTRARPGVLPHVLLAHLDAFEWPSADEDPREIDACWPLERQLEALSG